MCFSTSLTMERQMLSKYFSGLDVTIDRSRSQESLRSVPKPKMYSLASRTRCKLPVPVFLSNLFNRTKNFFFCHAFGRTPVSIRQGPEFAKGFHGFLRIDSPFGFHVLIPSFSKYTGSYPKTPQVPNRPQPTFTTQAPGAKRAQFLASGGEA